jgi:hypothetical protein
VQEEIDREMEEGIEVGEPTVYEWADPSTVCTEEGGKDIRQKTVHR